MNKVIHTVVSIYSDFTLREIEAVVWAETTRALSAYGITALEISLMHVQFS